jgi:hypothetical protein
MTQKEIINKIVNAPNPDEVESVNALMEEANTLLENCKQLDKELVDIFVTIPKEELEKCIPVQVKY